jgi:hypothetical protein
MRVGIHPVSFNVNVSVAVSVSVFTCDHKLIFIWMTIIQTFSMDSMLDNQIYINSKEVRSYTNEIH